MLRVALYAAISASASAVPMSMLHAQSGAVQTPANSGFERFVPAPSESKHRLDWSLWSDALRYMVLWMGPSTREGAPTVDPGMGTRLTYGHESRYRLEGNRIVFSFLDDEITAPFAEYRADLERIGSEMDIAALPRDEQLAYWINLHNIAVVEQIALHYPVKSPGKIELGEAKTPLDTSPFITVAGVRMSPRDIRTKIVFPNWSDPMTIYGFFRGDVGGPSIQREAFTGENVRRLLSSSAVEFVNSLRGVEGYGDDLMVSKIYEEAAPFYFPQMAGDLRAHLATYAEDEVKALMAEKSQTKVARYVDDIADLAGGEREPSYSHVERGGLVSGGRISPSIARLLTERQEKYKKLRRDGWTGRVIVLPGSTVEESDEKAEVN